MIIKYNIVKLKKVIKGICGKCNKKASVTIISEQTVNPFNVNKQNIPKSAKEVYESVSFNLPHLVKRYTDKFLCSKCNKITNDKEWFGENEYDFLKRINKENK